MIALLGIACLLSWLGLAFFWHGFWRVDERLGVGDRDLPENAPSVIAIIPARNEEETIAKCLSGIAGQSYPRLERIIVVDDQSDDRTGEVASTFDDKRVQVITGEMRGDDWAGKMSALDQGVAAAENHKGFFWFTDADIFHRPDVLANMVEKAETGAHAMVSTMVRLRCRNVWEKLLVPAFIFYFTLLYPFKAVNNPASRIAGAAGGSMLVRQSALAAIGGIAAIKGAIIDDCALGKTIKRQGFSIWLGFSEQSTSMRGYDRLADFWRMVERSAYTQLGYSPVLLTAVLAGIGFSHLLPVWLVFAGHFLIGASILVLIVSIYWPTVRYYGLAPLWSLSLPLSGLLFGAMTFTSAVRYHLGFQNRWRDRDITGLSQ